MSSRKFIRIKEPYNLLKQLYFLFTWIFVYDKISNKLITEFVYKGENMEFDKIIDEVGKMYNYSDELVQALKRCVLYSSYKFT